MYGGIGMRVTISRSIHDKSKDELIDIINCLKSDKKLLINKNRSLINNIKCMLLEKYSPLPKELNDIIINLVKDNR